MSYMGSWKTISSYFLVGREKNGNTARQQNRTIVKTNCQINKKIKGKASAIVTNQKAHT